MEKLNINYIKNSTRSLKNVHSKARQNEESDVKKLMILKKQQIELTGEYKKLKNNLKDKTEEIE